MDRIATFRRFIEQRPTDPFPRYGLAMELRGQDRIAEAVTTFDELVSTCPDYVPTYLMFGTTLAKAGDKPRARTVMETGCEVAQRKGDRHALGELESALLALDD